MSGIFVYTDKGQYVSVVLAALFEMGGVNTKLQTIAHIEKRGWLELQREDYDSYLKHQYESIWHTKVAFARQFCVDNGRGLMALHNDRDMWEITQLGKERLLGVREKFRNGIYDLHPRHLWTTEFKIWMHPNYKPNALPNNDFI